MHTMEIIKQGQKCKPYLDVEFILKDQNEYVSKKLGFLETLINDIITIFKNEYKQEITRDDIYISDASRQTDDRFKASFHVIVSPSQYNLMFLNSSNRCASSAYHFADVLSNLSPLYQEAIDKSVYGNNKVFRLVNSAKFTKSDIDTKLYPVNKQFERVSQKLDENNFLKQVITYEDTSLQTIIINTPEIPQHIRISNNVSDKAQAIPTHSIINEILYRIHHFLPQSLIQTNKGDVKIHDWEGHTGIR